MKIAWFTPFSRSSSIARFSRMVAEELARSHEIDIWHPCVPDPFRTAVRTVAFPPHTQISPAMLAPYDIAAYNLGDHLPFHRDIWLASRAAPGIAILHDFVMHHFFAGYYLEERNSRAEYIAAMVRWYGEAGRAAAGSSFSGATAPLWESERVVEFPLFEEAIARAHAVIVHADFLRRKVEDTLPGYPVRKLSLAQNCPEPGRLPPREQLGVPRGRVLVVTLGQVNRNKCIPAVLDALARDAGLRERVYYAALIRERRLENTVRLVGYVPEELLRAWIAHAGIFVNLRYPAMEGGSGSLAEEMLAGKPVIVTDTGIYSEISRECVVKIEPGREHEQLSAALSGLVADSGARRALGARARELAEREFHPARYATGFLDLASEVLDAKPLLALADQIADRLARMGVHPDAAIVNRVAGECYSLFCDPDEEPTSR